IDAFGSDAIPLHLMTREALQIYMGRLKEGGVLAFHISNRYVDLEPVLANLAQDARLVCRIQEDRDLSPNDKARGYSPSVWIVMAQDPSHLDRLTANQAWKTARARLGLGIWTDDFSNLVSVLRWGE